MGKSTVWYCDTCQGEARDAGSSAPIGWIRIEWELLRKDGEDDGSNAIYCSAKCVADDYAEGGTMGESIKEILGQADDDRPSRALEGLLGAIRSLAIPLDDKLPVFSDDDWSASAYRQGVWSWDSTHAIVGTCIGDLEIVARGELSS